MTPLNGTWRIHQALHGYRDGHRLLQASLKLTSESASALLAVSDATGPAVKSGFDSYLVGIGLPHDKLFALARTWFATELERPGCVWTHSLLLPWDILGEIRRPGSLLRYFRRPLVSRVAEAAQEYSIPVEVLVEEQFASARPFLDVGLAASALSALYDPSRPPVVLFAESSLEVEAFVMELWNRQWSSLRRNLSFCTGQLSERPETRRFDVQVIPVERRFRWRHTMSGSVESGPEGQHRAKPSWVIDASERLVSGGELGDSLAPALQAALPADRGLGHFVLELSNELATTPIHELRVAAIAHAVAQWFPASSDAGEFKRALFAPGGAIWSQCESPIRAEEAFVATLLLSGVITAYDPDQVGLSFRLTLMWKNDPDRAVSLLLRTLESADSPAAHYMAQAACAALSHRELLHLIRRAPGCVQPIIRAVPEMLAEPELWQSSAQVRREAAVSLASLGAQHKELLARGVSAAISAGGADSLADVLRNSSVDILTQLVAPVVDALPTLAGWNLMTISNALKERSADIAHIWMQQGFSDAVGLAAMETVFDPSGHTAELLGPKVLRRIAGIGQSGGDARASQVAAVFVLVCALEAREDIVNDQVACVFETVFSAAAQSRLTQWSLHWLDRSLPHLGWWRDWDICERLQRSVAERLVDGRWQPSVLFELLPPGPDFSSLLRTIRWSTGGVEYLKRVTEAAKEGSPYWSLLREAV